MTLKEEFIHKMNEVGTPKIITVAVKLPNGAIESITNTSKTSDKALYYMENYDEEFRLKHNDKIQIVGFMIV